MLPVAVSATPTLPTASPTIISIKCFQDVLASTDFLLLFQYRIPYGTIPTPETADQLYTFSMLDNTGTTDYGDVHPYPYKGGGYNYGLSGIYFAPGFAPSWSGNYQIRIMGDPILFSIAGLTAPITYTTILPGDFDTSTTTADAKIAVGNYLVITCQSLQSSWATTLLSSSDTGVILSTTGQAYIMGIITNITYMAPQIMNLQNLAPAPITETWSTALGTSYANRYTGTWVQDSLNAIADLFHTSNWNLITGGLILILCIWIVAKSQKKFQRNDPALIIAGIVFYGASLLGFVSWYIVGITSLLFALYLGYIFIFSKSY
jgi:hypothetical protein